ncbi:twitching motility protein PilT [Spirochaetia bacterium]|nr:twitching motility protein PilT [Spirochaetia bacterium]
MTSFLVDTNVIIWLAGDNRRIKQVKELIFSEDTQVFVSAVSWWEIAIKIRIGKLPVRLNTLRALAEEHSFLELPLSSRYADTLAELPRIHNDPFDHMLLAQAITEPMRFITGDAILADYSSLVMVI